MLSSRTSRRDLMHSLISVSAVVAAMSAQRAIADDPETVATVLQPFVDQHELAGAVVLVADKDKALAL